MIREPSVPLADPRPRRLRLVLAALAILAGPLFFGGLAAARRAHWQVESLERLLAHSPDPLRRESAALALGRRGSPLAVDRLTAALAKDKIPWVRARCAEALGLIGDDRATAPLLSALAREKRQRVRRVVAEALLRLGRQEGVLELMWQLRSGTNHSKAEAMKTLVVVTGRPLGQQVKDWWSYLAAGGYTKLDLRPKGGPALLELAGPPRVYDPAKRPAAWRLLPTVVLRLKPRRLPVSSRTLRAYEGWRGPIADGCLVLIETDWQRAPKPSPARRRPGGRPQLVGPGLTLDAVKYLFKRAPHLLGVGIDAPTLDLPALHATHPVRDFIRGKGRIAIEQVADLRHLNATGTRLLLLNGADRPHLLAILP